MTKWELRDYPVLRALVNTDNEEIRSGYLGLSGGRETGTLGLSLSDGEIHDSLLTLAEAGYIHFDRSLSSGAHAMFTHLQVTGAGYQALGEWPFFTEVTPSTLAAMLERFADEAPTEEEAENARRAADYVRRISGDAFKAAVKTVVVEGVRGALQLGVIG